MQTKLKLTALAGAVALAGLAGGAQAAIDQTDTGDGELFFSVWDASRNTSYTRDLGLQLTDLSLAGVAGQQGTIYSFSADALLTTFLADTMTANGNLDRLIWNIGAGDSVGTGLGLNRGLYTGNFTEAAIEINSSNVFGNALGGMNIQISQMNLVGTHPTLADGSNIATLGGDPNDDQAYAGQATWGVNAGGLSGVNTTGHVGDALNFWFVSNGSSAFAKVSAQQFMGALGAAMWTFESDGTLTFATPVPEAETWALLGLGLLGAGAVARRRSRALA